MAAAVGPVSPAVCPMRMSARATMLATRQQTPKTKCFFMCRRPQRMFFMRTGQILAFETSGGQSDASLAEACSASYLSIQNAIADRLRRAAMRVDGNQVLGTGGHHCDAIAQR